MSATGQIDKPLGRQPETPKQAAEAYLAKLTRWDDLLNFGEPGKRQLRKAIRAERHAIERALLMDKVVGGEGGSDAG